VAHIDEVLSDLFTPGEEETLAALLRRLRDHLYDSGAEWALSQDDDGDGCPGAE